MTSTCPKCGGKHRKASSARNCETIVNNAYTLWVIAISASSSGTLSAQHQSLYEEDKAMYEAMKGYMQQF